jgi:hypothetical protein
VVGTGVNPTEKQTGLGFQSYIREALDFALLFHLLVFNLIKLLFCYLLFTGSSLQLQ